MEDSTFRRPTSIHLELKSTRPGPFLRWLDGLLCRALDIVVSLLALILYPFVWLILLPFRLLGIAVDAVFQTLKAILLLPARVLRGPKAT